MNTALAGIGIAVGLIGIVITLFVSGAINMGGDNNGQIIQDNSGQIIQENSGQIAGRDIINNQDSIPLKAVITPITAGPYYVGNSIEFSADDSTTPQGTSLANYEWDIEEETKNGLTIRHEFKQTGTHTIGLTIKNSANTSDRTEYSINVLEKSKVKESPVSLLPSCPNNTKMINGECIPMNSPISNSNSNLLGEWNFEVAAEDTSGNKNHGIIIGDASLVPGKVGNALIFDGINDYVSIPNMASLDIGTGDFSFSAWIKTRASGSFVILDARTVDLPNSMNGFYLGSWISDVILVQMADGVEYTMFPSGESVYDGEFHHIAVTVDRDSKNGGHIYIDGVNALTFDPTVRPGSLDNVNDFRIGRLTTPNSFNVDHYSDGIIDQVRFYNDVLSPAEVNALFTEN